MYEAVKGLGIITVKKDKKYCSYCGGSLTAQEIEGKTRDFCPHCKTVFYENPLPVASAIVINDTREVLLVKRAKDPYKDMWCLPIGFAESGEKIEHAALRELKEEAGIDGEIVRLIDVDTVDNYFYGSLAIVTYEIRKTGGLVTPGDDASEAAYFPLTGLPPLAWSSNEKAISLFRGIYRDIWYMADSFKRLFPEAKFLDSINLVLEQDRFLSHVLVEIIEKHMDAIEKSWHSDLENKLPYLMHHADILAGLNKNSLKGIQYWLKRGSDTLGVEEFIGTGQMLKEHNVPLPDVLSLLSFSRKALWTVVAENGIFASPLEIYNALEINNRIIYYYDKINYYITRGYFA